VTVTVIDPVPIDLAAVNRQQPCAGKTHTLPHSWPGRCHDEERCG
jgi:hypothetical protein